MGIIAALAHGQNQSRVLPSTCGLVGLTRRASAEGLRVGIRRIFRALEELKLPATILLNSLVCENYPDVVERIKQRGDEVW